MRARLKRDFHFYDANAGIVAAVMLKQRYYAIKKIKRATRRAGRISGNSIHLIRD